MIFIPNFVWDKLLLEFRRRWRKVEQVAFLDGIELGSSGVVTTLTIPNAKLSRGNYCISASAMNEAGRHLGPMIRIAQVHTHPGAWTGHSEYDDDRAFSHHDGAVSIVIPNYAKSDFSMSELGVHICKNKVWHELSDIEKNDFLRIVPWYFDFRR